MVTTTAAYTDIRYRTPLGEGFDGVVRVNFGGFYGTGTLLFDGRAVLTAAHLFDGRTGTASVTFETSGGIQVRSATQILQHPGYDDANTNNDLALVWLSSTAPIAANRHDLYRASNEIGQPFVLVGYGQMGTGSSGSVSSTSTNINPIRLKAANQFDADAITLKNSLGSAMGWAPLAGTQLIADFDNGLFANDALGRLIGRSGSGLGLDEGLIAPGDSGGPAFLDGKVAGVASYIATFTRGSTDPDIDDPLNSSFGEIAAWQRVSAYQQWIDQSLRALYPNAPTRPDEVKQKVAEGNSGTSYAYFLLQFGGVRSDPAQVLSVDYATRSGTASGGSDYLSVAGTLRLYPGENQAVVPVEIVGDNVSEGDEVFYLDVFNPLGGNFGAGVIQLTAMRTILNDDGFFG